MQDVILEADNISRYYGERPALVDFSFKLQSGRIIGFLGPNGAGKTTAIRILTTILEPSNGTFRIGNIESHKLNAIRSKIGVLPESQGYPSHLTGIEYLLHFGLLYGIPKDRVMDRSYKLLEEVGLENRVHSLIKTYSRGMRQRLGIARALINNPIVIFLDEPTLGLDPRGQKELLDMIQRIAKQENAGIILCSHLLSEVEAICDDVVILKNGKIVASGSVEDVLKISKRKRIRISVPQESIELASQILKRNSEDLNFQVTVNSNWLEIEPLSNDQESTDSNNFVIKALIDENIPILDFRGESGQLQDVFLELTQEAIQ